MARALVLMIVFVVAGCTRPELPVPVTTWRAAEIGPALLSPTACPAWPAPVTGSEEAGVGYDLSGYAAYRCERSTRMKIAEQAKRIAGDVARENGRKK